MPDKRLISGGAALIACLVIFGFLYNKENLTTSESMLFSIVLSMASVFMGWSFSSVSSEEREKNRETDLIDTTARLASGRIMAASKDLYEAEDFIARKRDEFLASDQVKSYEILDGVSQKIASIRSANITFVTDWTIVASTGVSEEIRANAEEQTALFRGNGRDDGSNDEALPTNSTNKNVSEYGVVRTKLANFYYPSSTKPAPVVGEVFQSPSENSTRISKGELQVNILRPSYAFTVSGKHDPLMEDKPDSGEIKLLSSPDNMPDDCRVSTGYGTNFDFTIHVKSQVLNVSLPIGTYVFEYEYTINNEN